MNINDTTRRCQDCGEEFEVLMPKNLGEIRCISCQVQFRMTGKTAIERYVEALAESMSQARPAKAKVEFVG